MSNFHHNSPILQCEICKRFGFPDTLRGILDWWRYDHPDVVIINIETGICYECLKASEEEVENDKQQNPEI